MSVPSWAEPYIELMNGNVAQGFFWQDINSFLWYGDTQGRSVVFDPKSISYWSDGSNPSDYHSATLGGCTLLTVNVTENAGVNVSISATGTRRNIEFATGIWGSAWQFWKNQNETYSIQAISAGNPQDTVTFNETRSNLQDAISWVALKFKNIKLFVNGEDWTQETTYTWQSVPAITGKNGISLLSIIKSSAINSGDAVSGASADAFDRLEESTKISTLIQGISGETPIIYSDDINYMSITPTTNNTCTLKFYLHGTVIYTLANVNINSYLSFLIDETNGIMKPSIIYEDS